MTTNGHNDVVILGGGLAGLTLAIQLKQAHPAAGISVVEKANHPLPEAALKVGESTVEGGAHYFGKVIGMKEHIEKEELPKLSLRWFFPWRDNRDITRRVEVGLADFPPHPSYQLDRGRFENALGERARELGVTFLDGTRVESVVLGQDQHQVTVQRDGEAARTLQARWLVDASGRAAILKRQLGLTQKNDHDACASWFRLAEHIKIDDWSDDPEWQARIPNHNRWLSTNHLMGAGYWVWLIPLASGSHSIGIVVDPTIHPFDQINTFDRAMQWLSQHEPQLWEKVNAKRELLQDFRVLKHYSHGCERVYSPDRWCLTGESGVFLDPFYSPGSEYIFFSNNFVTKLISEDLGGEEAEANRRRAEAYNEMFLMTYHKNIKVFEDLYPIFGNAQVMIGKTRWDTIVYWAGLGVLCFHDKWTDLGFMKAVRPSIDRMNELNTRLQAFFHDWDRVEHREWQDAFGAHGNLDILAVLHVGLDEELTDQELQQRIVDNVGLCETAAIAMFRKAAPLVGNIPEEQSINPYAISLQPERWESDGLFRVTESPKLGDYSDVDIAGNVDRFWLGPEHLAELPTQGVASNG